VEGFNVFPGENLGKGYRAFHSLKWILNGKLFDKRVQRGAGSHSRGSLRRWGGGLYIPRRGKNWSGKLGEKPCEKTTQWGGREGSTSITWEGGRPGKGKKESQKQTKGKRS